MAKKRDSWDKINRQKKIYGQSDGVGFGPSPVGGVVNRLVKRRNARIEAEDIRIKAEIEAEDLRIRDYVRKFAISKTLRPWIEKNQIVERFVVDAIKAECGNRPIRRSGIAFRFFEFCEALEAIHRSYEGFTIEPAAEFVPWLLKFKQRDNGASLRPTIKS